MTVREALRTGTEMLKSANIEAPAVDAGVILCHILKCSNVYLYAHDDKVLSEVEARNFLKSIENRMEGMPVAYIIGHREFMSLDFKVTPFVLIPRPETEILVETVISYARQMQAGNSNGYRHINILDIGTGSGCIAISLAYYLGDCRVTAVDISDKALEIAMDNACANGVKNKIIFIKSDCFSNIDESGLFHVIVSNPPYISVQDMDCLQEEVKKYEPVSALNGGIDGLDFYRRIISDAPQYLHSNGMLAFEVGYNQAEKVSHLMEEHFNSIRKIRDLSGIYRVVTGIKM